ncbi:hypothetical protein FSARC_7033 [Fusarium sarcochroum]|uniref:Uncharacterized protein n=1 Tax=Fusarium sarcochroum TaxID=1208366 RepID=A0A8H4X7T5_9HYPO|nr:hypothetical protein FSARC_7033 [Fusarium sarcochroum]
MRERTEQSMSQLKPTASGTDETGAMSSRLTGDVSAQPYCSKDTQDQIPVARMVQMGLPEFERDVRSHSSMPVQEPAILMEHTTRAGLLLDWTSISVNTRRHTELQGIRSTNAYPMRQETERAGLFEEYEVDVVTFPERLDFSESSVDKYVASFKVNILNMHPIINPRDVDLWVCQFRTDLPLSSEEDHRSTRPSVDIKAGTCEPRESRPSNGGWPKNSIKSALVLIILALGKVCLYRYKVPGACFQKDPLPCDSSTAPVYSHMCAPDHYPPVGLHPHQSYGKKSPVDVSTNSGSSGHFLGLSTSIPPTSGSTTRKDSKEIPGLDYFSYATKTLDSHTVLRSASQAIREFPLQSSGQLHMADDDILNPELNTLALGFWSLQQLASDLGTEIDLDQPELLRDVTYEVEMLYPNMSLLEGFERRVLEGFLGQLYLTKHLNIAHRMFFATTDTTHIGWNQTSSIEVVSQFVLNMDWVPPSFDSSENHPPADDILTARLWAKYWGAQVITFRPFVLQVLRYERTDGNLTSSPNFTAVSKLSRVQIGVMEGAKKGIKALIESTRAFYGLREERPIITSVFDTAHA